MISNRVNDMHGLCRNPIHRSRDDALIAQWRDTTCIPRGKAYRHFAA